MTKLGKSFKKKSIHEKRITVLRLEMDYELATLFDAIKENNEAQKKISKEKLRKIRNELIALKGL